jgi:hypothetical protein
VDAAEGVLWAAATTGVRTRAAPELSSADSKLDLPTETVNGRRGSTVRVRQRASDFILLQAVFQLSEWTTSGCFDVHAACGFLSELAQSTMFGRTPAKEGIGRCEELLAEAGDASSAVAGPSQSQASKCNSHLCFSKRQHRKGGFVSQKSRRATGTTASSDATGEPLFG